MRRHAKMRRPRHFPQAAHATLDERDVVGPSIRREIELEVARVD